LTRSRFPNPDDVRAYKVKFLPMDLPTGSGLELYILRHGEAGRSLAPSTRDSRRPLTEDGRKEVSEVAESIASLKIRFDHIVSSPLSRAAETALLVAKTAKPSVEVEFWDELKPEGDSKKFCSRLAKLGENSVVLAVGHEPYLTGLISEITGGPGARLVLKKSGLARISVSSFEPEFRGQLRWLLSPRILKRIS